MEFTPRQLNDIDLWQALIIDSIVACAVDQDRAAAAADDAAFYGPLCDMVAEYCANHGVDIRYPVHVTDGDEERIEEFAEPTDLAEREYWARLIDDKILKLKETQHEQAEDEEAEND